MTGVSSLLLGSPEVDLCIRVVASPLLCLSADNKVGGY